MAVQRLPLRTDHFQDIGSDVAATATADDSDDGGGKEESPAGEEVAGDQGCRNVSPEGEESARAERRREEKIRDEWVGR